MIYYYTIYKWQHIFLYRRQTTVLHFNANASTNGNAATKQQIVTFPKSKNGNQLSEPYLIQLTSVSFMLSHNLLFGKHWNKIKTTFPHDCTKLLGWTMFAIPNAWLSLGWKKLLRYITAWHSIWKKKQWKTGNSPLLTSSKTPNWQQWKKLHLKKYWHRDAWVCFFFGKKMSRYIPTMN